MQQNDSLADGYPQAGLGRGMLPRQHADVMMNSRAFRRVSQVAISPLAIETPPKVPVEEGGAAE